MLAFKSGYCEACVEVFTVAILAQGTSWTDALAQVFFEVEGGLLQEVVLHPNQLLYLQKAWATGEYECAPACVRVRPPACACERVHAFKCACARGGKYDHASVAQA